MLGARKMIKMKYTYNDYENDIRQLAHDIKLSGQKYDYVVGLSRGGLVAGVHLSHIIDVPFVPLIWSGSTGQKDTDCEVLLTNANVLIVDDILDSGETIKEIFNCYGHRHFACLIYNKSNKAEIVPTFHGWMIDKAIDPRWVDFWWEN